MVVAQPVVAPSRGRRYVGSPDRLHGVAEMLIVGPQTAATAPSGSRLPELESVVFMLPIAVEDTQLTWPQRRAKLAGPLARLGAAAGVDIGAWVRVYHSSAWLLGG